MKGGSGGRNKPLGATHSQNAIGDVASFPKFATVSLQTQDEKSVTLRDLMLASSNGLVVFVYPKANTPGCTKQAKSFRDVYKRLSQRGYQVVGMSTDKPAAQAKWKQSLDLPYDLLCEANEVLKELGCLGTLNLGFSTRSVFVFGKDGSKQLERIKVSPAASVEAVLKFVGDEDPIMPDTSACGTTDPTDGRELIQATHEESGGATKRKRSTSAVLTSSGGRSRSAPRELSATGRGRSPRVASEAAAGQPEVSRPSAREPAAPAPASRRLGKAPIDSKMTTTKAKGTDTRGTAEKSEVKRRAASRSTSRAPVARRPASEQPKRQRRKPAADAPATTSAAPPAASARRARSTVAEASVPTKRPTSSTAPKRRR